MQCVHSVETPPVCGDLCNNRKGPPCPASLINKEGTAAMLQTTRSDCKIALSQLGNLVDDNGDQLVGDCPFCKKEQHFYVNADTGQWDCKRCGENGNWITFLRQLHAELLDVTNGDDYAELAELKPGISACVLEDFALACNPLGRNWLIPTFNSKDEVSSLRTYDPETNRVMSLKGSKQHLLGLYDISDNGPIYICEGEWDCMAMWGAIDEGSVVGVPGASTSVERCRAQVADRDVVLCYDNDDAGRKGREQAIQQIGGCVKSLKFIEWNGQPDGYDIRDLAAKYGPRKWKAFRKKLKSLLEEIETAELQKCRTVENAEIEVVEVPEFPLEVFPPELKTFFEDSSKDLSIDSGMIAVPFLATAGTCIGPKCSLEVKRKWSEMPSIWVCTVAETGQAKTPALNVSISPLESIQQEWHDEHGDALEEYERNKKEQDNEGEVENSKPVRKRIITNDTTVEAIPGIIEGCIQTGLLVYRNEMSGFLRSMDKYRSGAKGADRSFWLETFDGKPVTIDRVGRMEFIPSAAINIVGTIQPDVLGEFQCRTGAEDGFVPRYLWCFPEPSIRVWSESGNVNSLLPIYWSLIELPSRRYRLSKSAKRAFIEWWEDTLRRESLSPMNGVLAKLTTYAPRLALILHCLNPTERAKECVNKKTVQKAIQLAEYFERHAEKVHSRMRTAKKSKEVSQGDRLLAWMKDRNKNTVTAREVLTAKIAPNSESAKILFQKLEADGIGTVSKPRKRRVEFTLI